jgi:hypothetical protein
MVFPLIGDSRPINAGKTRAESAMSVFDYGEEHWLPWVRENCKPSTIAGYETYWNAYLAPQLEKISLRMRPSGKEGFSGHPAC